APGEAAAKAVQGHALLALAACMLADPLAALCRALLARLGEAGVRGGELGIAHLAVVVGVDAIEADLLARFAVGLVELAVVIGVEPVERLVDALDDRGASHFALRRLRRLGISN